MGSPHVEQPLDVYRHRCGVDQRQWLFLVVYVKELAFDRRIKIVHLEAFTRRRSSGSRIAFASSRLAPRNVTNRANPRARASANVSSLPRDFSSSQKPRMTKVFVVRSSLLSKRATSLSPHRTGSV